MKPTSVASARSKAAPHKSAFRARPRSYPARVCRKGRFRLRRDRYVRAGVRCCVWPRFHRLSCATMRLLLPKGCRRGQVRCSHWCDAHLVQFRLASRLPRLYGADAWCFCPKGEKPKGNSVRCVNRVKPEAVPATVCGWRRPDATGPTGPGRRAQAPIAASQ